MFWEFLGSLRKGSFNSGLLRAAQEVAPDGMEINIFNLKDIPFYNGDVEADGNPASVFALKGAIQNGHPDTTSRLRGPESGPPLFVR